MVSALGRNMSKVKVCCWKVNVLGEWFSCCCPPSYIVGGEWTINVPSYRTERHIFDLDCLAAVIFLSALEDVANCTAAFCGEDCVAEIYEDIRDDE